MEVGTNQNVVNGRRLLIDPVRSSTMFLMNGAEPGSFMRSVDGGITWEETRFTVPGTLAPLDTAILDPLHPNVLIAGASGVGIVEYEVAPDLSVSSLQFVGGSDPLPTDSSISGTITVVNRGPHAASAAEVRVTLPSFLTTNVPENCALAAQVLTCQLTALRVDTPVTIQLALEVSQAPGAGQFVATISGHERDPDTTNNTLTYDFSSTLQSTMDLTLEPTQVSPVARTDLLSFQARVRNDGLSRARDVRLELDTGTLIVQGIEGPAGACTHTENSVSCDFGTLEGLGTASVLVNTQVTAIGANTASGTASRAGTDAAAMDTAMVIVTAAPLADFALEVAASSNSVLTGGALNYTMTVRNVGPDPAPAQVVANFTNVTLGTATTTGGTCAVANGGVTCDMSELTSGSSATISVAATAGSAGSSSVSGTITAGGADREAANNSANASTTVSAPPPPPSSSSSSGGKGGGGSLDWLLLGLSALLLAWKAPPRRVSRARLRAAARR
jgi:hypothetical protein